MNTTRARSRGAASASSASSAPAHRRLPHGPVRARLPWWAAAMPVLAFVLLLSLLLGSEADAAQQQAGDYGGAVVVAVLERVAQALLG
jgi:hypothetical protein